MRRCTTVALAEAGRGEPEQTISQSPYREDSACRPDHERQPQDRRCALLEPRVGGVDPSVEAVGFVESGLAAEPVLGRRLPEKRVDLKAYIGQNIGL